jgi:hypothetical protein
MNPKDHVGIHLNDAVAGAAAQMSVDAFLSRFHLAEAA